MEGNTVDQVPELSPDKSMDETVGTQDNGPLTPEDAVPPANLHQDRTIVDWMRSSKAEQRDIEVDIGGRMSSLGENIFKCSPLIGIDLGLLEFGDVIRDLAPYITGENLPEVAQGIL
jgi:hypothetical protein